MYQIIENGKVIHESHNGAAVQHWAFILRNTQGRNVRVQFSPKH